LIFKEKNFEIKKITNLSKWVKSQISPVCSFFGGIVSQEIIKYTGKYIPHNQFF
jgi:ubiquitin-activating enzyme E1